MKKEFQNDVQGLDQNVSILREPMEQSEKDLLGIFSADNNSYSYFVEVEQDIGVFYIDETCTDTIQLASKSSKDDFVCLYYTISDENSELVFKIGPEIIKGWGYNFFSTNRFLKVEPKNKETKVDVLCIFMRKEVIARHLENIKGFEKKTFFNEYYSQSNALRYEQISGESFQLLRDLQKRRQQGGFNDFDVIGTVYLLFAEYSKKMSEQMLKSSLISRRNEETVIKAQYYMLKNIDKQFPGIEYLSQYCGISSSLFKRSFKEVTGYTSYNFFIENKLFKAKELLEESDLSIATISNELNFSNPSYFSIMFKKKFGMLPKYYRK